MKHIIIGLLLVLCSTFTYASRKEILLNNDWMFRFSHQVQKKSEQRVNLPHTWNSGDALSRIITVEWVTMKKLFS